MTDTEGLPTITHTICECGSTNREAVIRNNDQYCISAWCGHIVHMRGQSETLFVYLARELQWGLCFPACLLASFHNLSWFMVWKRFFQRDSETAYVLDGCHVIIQSKWSRPILPKLSFFSCRPLCYVVSWVKVYRVRVDTVSSHPSSLEVWKYSVTRPPPPPPPLSFQNYLSISDKQLHQKTGLSSVNTELPDMIHQSDAVCSKHSKMLSLWWMKDLIHGKSCSDFYL